MSIAKFLHIADTHFDAPLKSKDDVVRVELRESTFIAFETAVSDALAEVVDAVLIAGDLFDGDRVSLETETRLREQFGRLALAGIPVIVATGNHDPSGMSHLSRRIDWPSNVTIVGAAEPRLITIESRSLPEARPVFVIAVAGHEHHAHADNIVSRFPVATGALPYVGLVHAMVSSPSSSGQGTVHDRYAPCTPDDLKRTGYSYWALGHVHMPGQIAGSNAFYSGCLQGRHYKEGGARGGFLVSIDADGMAVPEFRRYAPVVWEEIVIDEVPGDLGRLKHLVFEGIEALRISHAEARLAIRVLLRGQSDLASLFRDADDRAAIEGKWKSSANLVDVIIEASALFARLDLARLSAEPTVLSEVIGILRRLGDSDSVEIPAEFLDSIDCDAFDQPASDLKELLRDLQLEVAERMVDVNQYNRTVQ